MKYTIKFDLHIDDEEIWEDREITFLLKECIDRASVRASDVKILDVND